MQGGKIDEENQTLGSSDYGVSADIDRSRGSWNGCWSEDCSGKNFVQYKEKGTKGISKVSNEK